MRSHARPPVHCLSSLISAWNKALPRAECLHCFSEFSGETWFSVPTATSSQWRWYWRRNRWPKSGSQYCGALPISCQISLTYFHQFIKQSAFINHCFCDAHLLPLPIICCRLFDSLFDHQLFPTEAETGQIVKQNIQGNFAHNTIIKWDSETMRFYHKK